MFISPRCNVYFHLSLLWIRIMHFSTCEQRVCQRGSVFAAPTISFVFFWRCSPQVFICDPCLGSCVFLSFFGIQTCSCGPVRATWRYNLQREQSNFWLRIVFLHCLRVFTGKLFVYPMMEFWGFPFSTFHLFPQFSHCKCCSCLSSMEEIAMPISRNGGMRYWLHGRAPNKQEWSISWAKWKNTNQCKLLVVVLILNLSFFWT